MRELEELLERNLNALEKTYQSQECRLKSPGQV